MSWQSVSVIFIFVAGAVGSAGLGHKELALCLAGAAAGFVHLGGRIGRVKKKLPPTTKE